MMRSDSASVGSAGARADRRVHACPAVRKRARLLGLSLAAICGSGREGRITPADVARYAAGGAPDSETRPAD
ncbi:E3 binding domain-containing protein [Salinicola tamaricis]|uniref:E3 binding domain-containing protein n=1 Tax=Salinicola tamaricis TaxID=1771309 RepID=UPI0013EAAA11|nr:E3 binding domain-containing protein [Salinicola tamaricis]